MNLHDLPLPPTTTIAVMRFTFTTGRRGPVHLFTVPAVQGSSSYQRTNTLRAPSSITLANGIPFAICGYRPTVPVRFLEAVSQATAPGCRFCGPIHAAYTPLTIPGSYRPLRAYALAGHMENPDIWRDTYRP